MPKTESNPIAPPSPFRAAPPPPPRFRGPSLGARLGQAMRKAGGALRRPKVAIPVALGVLLVGGGVAMAVFGVPDVVDDLRASVGAPVSLKDLVRKAKEDPKDA